jgi:outer membrane protein assembly factor BamB
LEDLIYVGSSDGHLYALDRATGEVSWRFLVGQGVLVWTSPSVVDGSIYFGAHDGFIYVLQEANGQ